MLFGMRARRKPEVGSNNHPLVDGRSHPLPPSVLKANDAAEMNYCLGATVGLLVNALHPPDERLPGIEIDKVGWR
jgi:hypothetical protein